MKQRKTNKKKSNKVILSKTLQNAFAIFIEDHPATRLSKNIRSMMFEFLMHDGAIEAMYLQDLLYDIEALFELLDTIQSETSTNKR